MYHKTWHHWRQKRRSLYAKKGNGGGNGGNGGGKKGGKRKNQSEGGKRPNVHAGHYTSKEFSKLTDAEKAKVKELRNKKKENKQTERQAKTVRSVRFVEHEVQDYDSDESSSVIPLIMPPKSTEREAASMTIKPAPPATINISQEEPEEEEEEEQTLTCLLYTSDAADD